MLSRPKNLSKSHVIIIISYQDSENSIITVTILTKFNNNHALLNKLTNTIICPKSKVKYGQKVTQFVILFSNIYR